MRREPDADICPPRRELPGRKFVGLHDGYDGLHARQAMQRHFAEDVVVAYASDDRVAFAASDFRAHSPCFDLLADVVELRRSDVWVRDDDYGKDLKKKAREVSGQVSFRDAALTRNRLQPLPVSGKSLKK